MPSRGRDIVVIGTSAGGLEAVDNLLSQLPNGLPATVFVVQHLAPQSTAETLLPRLKKHKGLKCSLALNGKAFQRGRLYIARPDYHLLIWETKCWREAAFVACKKAKQSSLTSSRGPKASRQKTSDPSNREHKTTCEERKVAAGQLF